MVERWHRVEEVGRVARAGVDRAGRGRGIGIGVPDRGDGPGRRDDLDRLEASGELRSQGQHPDATRHPCANLVEVRVTAQRGIVGAKAVRRDERALDVQAERDGRHPGLAAAGSAASAASTVPRGLVTTVGRKLVTPWRGSIAAPRWIDAGSAVKSASPTPFTWSSMNPGAALSPAPSIVGTSDGPSPSSASISPSVTRIGPDAPRAR